MKLLRSPWVVGALVVVAIVVVAFQAFKPQWQRWRTRVGGAVSAKADAGRGAPNAAVNPPAPVSKSNQAAPKTPSVYAPPPKNPGTPAKSIDANYVASRFVDWVSAPPRDPFLAVTVSRSDTNSVAEGPNPVPTWKLTGIWRQTGGRSAAINGQIYSEGDEIEGWKVERIEADQVVFRGTNRVERLTIFSSIPGSPPSAPTAQDSPRTRKLGQRPRLMQDLGVSPQPL
jgi:hypothetical protein